MFPLPRLVELTEDEIGVTVTLSPDSVTLINAMYSILADISNWSGEGDELTDAEIDQIDAMVSGLYAELTT